MIGAVADVRPNGAVPWSTPASSADCPDAGRLSAAGPRRSPAPGDAPRGGPPTLLDERCRRHHGGAPSPRVRPLHRDLSESSLREGTEMSSVSGSAIAVTAGDPDSAAPPPYARDAEEVATALGSDLTMGLTGAESAARLTRYGPNQITAEKPPSTLAVALVQLRNPMNIMLIAVTVVSFADRRGLDRRHRGPADRAQRRARHPAGAEGPGQRGRAVEAAGPAGQGGPRRRAGRWSRPSTWCPATSSSSRPVTSSRRTGGSSGRPRWRRRRRRSPGRARPVAKDGAVLPAADVALGRPHEHAVPEHLGHPGHRVDGGHRHRHGRPRWVRSPPC